MKQKRCKDELIIWSVCTVFITLLTIIISYVNTKYGFGFSSLTFMFAIALLQFFKMTYESFAYHKNYNYSLVKSITNCRTVYLMINISLCTGFLFAWLIGASEISLWGIPRYIYLSVIVLLAFLITIKPIQQYNVDRKNNRNKRYPGKLINAFAPRFVALYTFVVYYLFALLQDNSSSTIIPSLCVVYIGIERLITMFHTVNEYSKMEYYSIYRDTVKKIREIKKIS